MMKSTSNAVLFLRFLAIVGVVLLILPSVSSERAAKRSKRWDAYLGRIIRVFDNAGTPNAVSHGKMMKILDQSHAN